MYTFSRSILFQPFVWRGCLLTIFNGIIFLLNEFAQLFDEILVLGLKLFYLLNDRIHLGLDLADALIDGDIDAFPGILDISSHLSFLSIKVLLHLGQLSTYQLVYHWCQCRKINDLCMRELVINKLFVADGTVLVMSQLQLLGLLHQCCNFQI